MGHGIFNGPVQRQQLAPDASVAVYTGPSNALTEPIPRSIQLSTENAIRGIPTPSHVSTTVQCTSAAGPDHPPRLAAECCQCIRPAWPEETMEPLRGFRRRDGAKTPAMSERRIPVIGL